MMLICEIFPEEAIRLLVALQDRGVAVRVSDDQLVIEPASLLTATDRAEIALHLKSLALAAAFATDVVIRQVVGDYLAHPAPTPDAAFCRCGHATDSTRCWRCEIAAEIAVALLRQQSVADCEAA